MLKVAICDDNEDFTKRIEEHTEHFSHENNIDVKVSRFISGPQLMLSNPHLRAVSAIFSFVTPSSTRYFTLPSKDWIHSV